MRGRQRKIEEEGAIRVSLDKGDSPFCEIAKDLLMNEIRGSRAPAPGGHAAVLCFAVRNRGWAIVFYVHLWRHVKRGDDTEKAVESLRERAVLYGA